MCGIVAMISKQSSGFPFKSKGVFSQMLYANALRGFDSTGVFGVNKYGNLKMVKASQQAADFLRTKTVNEFIDDIFTDFNIVVGHNRAATKGATTDMNAHPFIEGTTCLIHNGTLHNHKHLKDVDVDSHAICHAINTGDPKEVIPALDGAYALVWYDAAKKQLNITRNDERPLWIVETTEVDYIASEPEMLTWLLTRTGVKADEAKYFETGEIYTYDVDNLKDGFSSEKLPEKKPLPVVVAGTTQNVVKPTYNLASGGSLQNNYYKDYKHGDGILLLHDNNTIFQNKHTFRGTTTDKHKVRWCATLKAEDGLELVNEDYFVGVVRGISWKANVPTLIIDSLVKQPAYVSCNGVLVTETEVAEHGGMCDTCGAWIDPDDEQFWIRYKSGKIKAMKCQTCIEKDDNLKHLIVPENDFVH